jgi:hypothetical protein
MARSPATLRECLERLATSAAGATVTSSAPSQGSGAGGVAAPVAALEAPARDALVVDHAGITHHIGARLRLGRDPGLSVLALVHESVSRCHAQLEWSLENGSFMIRDLGSTNGTFVEGIRVHGAAPLKDRQLISCGRVHLVFLEAEPRHARPSVPSCAPPPTSLAKVLRLTLGAGGGRLALGSAEVRLGGDELALVKRLADKGQDESADPAELRGFVRTDELAVLIGAPGAAASMRQAAARQLAARVRATLRPLGALDVLEVCERRGYRLRLPVIVRFE